MEREEQMYKDWEENIANSYDEEVDDTCFSAFLDGVKWADANPQFSKEKFIDKACEWLELHINDDKYYSCIGEETLIPYLINDFKRAMEE